MFVEKFNQSETAMLQAALLIVNDNSLDFDFQPSVFSTIDGGLLRLDSDEQFEVISQVLLRPQGAMASEPALRLRGVDYKDEDRVFAPIPPGLTAGAYDVVAINSDGTAGRVAGALTISPNAAPSITDIFPQTITVSGAAQFSISGSGFLPGILVGLGCEDGSAQDLAVTFIDSMNLTADYVPGALAPGLCVLDVINPDDQDAAYAAVRLRDSAEGIGAPASMAAMLTARRAPGLALDRVDGEGFNLYAIGGDDGTAANTLDTVEFAEVGEFGAIDGWVPSLMTLPAGRAFTWAGQFGAFLYLVGGHDGTSAVDTVLRAQILDPDAAPNVARHTFELATGAPGFAGGIQAYRVAAVFPVSDAANPEGQSLAGDSRNVFVPNRADVALRLEWDPVPGASAYNIYTNAPGTPYDGDSAVLELIATTAETSWLHTGQATDPLQIPLTPGETGVWHQVAGWNLGSARTRLAGAMTPLAGSPGSIVLYAMGGDDGSDMRRSDYEFSVISAADTLTPGYGGFSSGSDSLFDAVRDLAAWPVTAEGSDDSWIFVGTGLDSGGSASNDVERGTVSLTGDLGAFSAGGMSPATDWAGASELVGSTSIAVAGGLNGLASTSIRESFLTDSGSGPEMGNWNATGFSLLEPRIFSGTTHGSVFIYIAGGTDDMDETLLSVEMLTR